MSRRGDDRSSQRSHQSSDRRRRQSRNTTDLEHHPTETLSHSQSRTPNDQPQQFSSIMSRQKTAKSDAQQPDQDTMQQDSQTHKTQQKQEQMIPVDNDYYILNPWYDGQPRGPMYGLSQPLAHQVRPGMWWGRRRLYQLDEQGQDGGGGEGDQEDGDEHGDDVRKDHKGSQGPAQDQEGVERRESQPEHFETTIDGRRVWMRRMGNDETDKILAERESESGSRDRSRRSDEMYHGTSQQENEEEKEEEDEEPESEDEDQQREQLEQDEIQQREQDAQQEYYDRYRNQLSRLRARYPQALAEFLSTTLMIFLGVAGNLSSLTSEEAQGGLQTRAWSWGLSVMVGIYVGGGISGAHMNPLISVTFSFFRGLPWRQCGVYVIAQFLASIVGASLAWFVYRDAIRNYDPTLSPNMTGKAFYTLPQSFATPTTAYFTEFMAAACLICIVLALGDDQNSPPGAGMSGFILGLVVYLLTITLGYNTGPAMNPTRDLGPRLVALWVGYGKPSNPFASGWWAYGPWGGGFAGALVGALAYDFFIFVGGESPINYKTPQAGDIKIRAFEKKNQMKERAKKKFHRENPV